MTQKLVVTYRNIPGTPYLGQPRKKYDHLDEPIRALAPDEALLVALTASGAGREDALTALALMKRRLLHRFPRMRVTFIIDPEKHGVWVYRPAFKGPGGGRAIGPAKEDEVRARRID
jgi:hypothetical protein